MYVNHLYQVICIKMNINTMYLYFLHTPGFAGGPELWTVWGHSASPREISPTKAEMKIQCGA